MPTESRATRCGRRWALALFLLLASVATLTQAACTRDDVAAAMATAAVDLQATLVPWGATAQANVAAAASQVPVAFATAKGPAPAEVAGLEPTAIRITATPLPATAVVLPSNTPVPAATVAPPTATPLPSATAVPPSPTAVPPTATVPPPSPTPLPTATATATQTATPAPTATPTNTPTATPLPTVIELGGSIMRLVQGGPFDMGIAATSLLEECDLFRQGCAAEWFAASEPVHTVSLAPYFIDRTEVTNADFAAFLTELGGHVDQCLDEDCYSADESEIFAEGNIYRYEESAGDHPATGVTWFGAAAFCEWRGARLPTEAEWEKASAWDPDTGATWRYPWGDQFDGTLLNFCDSTCEAPQANADYDDGYAAAAPVGSYKDGRSPSGAYDMAGNVWEWVADWYSRTYYLDSPADNPAGPEEGQERVVRGGSWFDTGNFTGSKIRFPSAPDNADKTIGFRCAADVPSQP